MTVYETDNHPQSAVQHRELYLISHGNIMGSVGRLVVSNSLQPYGLQPTRLLCPWDSPDKNTGVGCHFLLQGDLPDPGIEPMSLCLLYWQVGSFPLAPVGSPHICVLYGCSHDLVITFKGV